MWIDRMNVAVVGAIVIGVAVLLVLVLRELRRLSRSAPEPVARLEARVEALTQQLGERIGQSTAVTGQWSSLVQRQLSDANRALTGLSDRLARLDEATRQVERVGQSISGLERILASPKLRGGLGEWTLEMLLSEILPADQIARQHPLPSRGVIVDLAVRAADERLIPIDSKFPLEAFRRLLEAERAGEDTEPRRRELHRAVRARVDEIARKYIAPEDGTLDFALMYVPSESVYYELAVREAGAGFLEYAQGRRVVVCSPNTLYAYLQAIVLGLRGVQIARNARALHAAFDHLRQDLTDARERLDRAGNQLRHAAQNLDAAVGVLGRAEARVDAAIGTGEAGALEGEPGGTLEEARAGRPAITGAPASD